MKETLVSISLWLKLIFEMKKNCYSLNYDIDNNYKICQNISKKIIELSKINLKIYGQKNIPDDEPVLIASNHRSFFDIILLLASIDVTTSFVAAKELYKYPILNKYIRSINCISVDRYTEDFQVIKKQLNDINETLKNSRLILFPEGECNFNTDEVNKFKKGGFMGKSISDCNIIPTYIGMNKIKKIGRWAIPKDDVSVSFGKSFKPSEEFERKFQAKEIAKYTREQVLVLKKQLAKKTV